MEDLGERIERLAVELAAMYQRSERQWRAYEREPDLVNAWRGGIDRYYADVEVLMHAALLDLGTDERSVAVVAAVIGATHLLCTPRAACRPTKRSDCVSSSPSRG
jgi:hypothetical protein